MEDFICLQALFPLPCRRHHFLQVVPEFPTQLLAGKVVVGIDRHYVSWTAGSDDIVEFHSAYFFESLDGLAPAEIAPSLMRRTKKGFALGLP